LSEPAVGAAAARHAGRARRAHRPRDAGPRGAARAAPAAACRRRRPARPARRTEDRPRGQDPAALPLNTTRRPTMSLKLYFAPGACSFVPHSLLAMAGADFEPVMVKLHKGEQNEAPFRALNPRGQVPVLVDGGEPITQILAIIQYLDAKFPQQQF